MADRLLAAVPQGRHAILWAHDAHVARQNTPYGFGWNSMGSRLNHVLGPEDSRTVTFSARRLDFNSKGVVRDGENGGRSEERRVGKGCGSTFRTRWSP